LPGVAVPVPSPAQPIAAPHEVTVRHGAAKKLVATPAPAQARPEMKLEPQHVVTEPLAPAPAPIEAPAAPVVVPVPAPPPPAPVVIEPVIAQLSDATVQAVARDHGADLAKCQTDGLHGEITVRFEIDAAGRVAKKQLSSTMGHPKVAGCILGMLGHWQFPKPPTGSAAGTYTLSFQ
jgi:hypothetical protein